MNFMDYLPENKEQRVMNISFWFALSPCEDIPGQWISHCLELDSISQGNTIEHALNMGIEAALMILEADQKTKINSLNRRAPDNFWNDLYYALDWAPKLMFRDVIQYTNEDTKTIYIYRSLLNTGPESVLLITRSCGHVSYQ